MKSERKKFNYETTSNHLKSRLETHIATEISGYSSLFLSKKS